MKKESSFGAWLYKQRRSLDLTRKAFADQVGCAQVTLRRIENDTLKPSKELALVLLEKLGIPEHERPQWVQFARGLTEHPDQAVDSAPAKPLTNLPSMLTTFIGRQKAQVEIINHLNKYRLVSLTGPGGVGKTRLSIKVGEQVLGDYPQGVWLVELASLNDPELLPQTVAALFGLVTQPNTPVTEMLGNFLRAKTILLILDNCEHLLDACAQFADTLLKSCPNLKILATSREALGITGEAIYRVPSLELPHVEQMLEKLREYEAVRLFEERAQLVQTDFVLTLENAAFVAQICSRLDGIPLALELAAAKIHTFSANQIAEQLEESFNLLTSGSRTALPRQQTIRASIEWSWGLLTESEQTFMQQLSVFSGGWTLKAAASIASGFFNDKSVFDLITSLLDKSLLQRTFDSSGGTRFNMLVTIQLFASQQLNESGQEASTRNQHAAYFIEFAEEADMHIHRPDQLEWIKGLASDHDNLRATLDWCVSNQKTELTLRLLNALGWAWDVRGYYDEARTWFEKIRELPDVNSFPALYAKLLNHMGRHYWMVTDFRRAQSILEESLAIWTKLGVNGELGMAETLDYLGVVARWGEQGSNIAKPYLNQSFAIYQKYGDQWGLAQTTLHLGIIEGDQSNDSLALSLFEQSIALYHQVEDLMGIARVSWNLGKLYLKLGNFERAQFYLEQDLRIDEMLQFKIGTEVALGWLGNLNRFQGKYEEAEIFYKRSLALCDEYGLKGDMGSNLFCLGMLALHQNNYFLARQYFIDYYNLVSKVYEKGSTLDLLIGLAAVAGGTSQPERAAKLHGASQTVLETIHFSYMPFDRIELDRHIQIAREQLGKTNFETFTAEGCAMTVDEAVAFALE
jgi:predicted ATPase/transcriptional regulator with XRE-family HTH domain